jgi:hypothetical protein
MMAGNRPPIKKSRAVARRKKLFLSVVLVVSNLNTQLILLGALARWRFCQILAKMSGMLDLSSAVNPKHFLPRSLSDAPIR